MRELTEMCAKEAMRRAAAVEVAAMRARVASLAIIATVAPWLGVLATMEGIVGSFPACGGPRPHCMAAVAERLSQSIMPVAAGLAVGMFAFLAHRWLLDELETLWLPPD